MESDHPYSNNTDETYDIDLADEVGWCADRVRLHFAFLDVESGYDTVEVAGSEDQAPQVFTGSHHDLWTDWLSIGQSDATRRASVRLISDYSVTRDGFVIDGAEWAGSPICPAVVYPPCAEGTIDVTPPLGPCDCPRKPVCVPLDDVEIAHGTQAGFMNTGHKLVGNAAYSYAPGPVDAPVDTFLGKIDRSALAAVVDALVDSGVLHGDGYQSYGAVNERFVLRAGATEVIYVAPEGEHAPAVAAAIDAFESLFTCGGSQPLTCTDQLSCVAGSCTTPDGCACIEIYAPVCGTNGVTYGNACKAGCAGAPVAHQGQCGVTGDLCGTFAGIKCQDGYKCRFGEGQYTFPYPDASGECVAETFCDAPVDCQGLPHIAVPGSWSCAQNQCEWVSTPAWFDVPGWTMETAHPYTNGQDVWKQLYLPNGAQAMRLMSQDGVFDLEAGYDFLEVWTWQGGAWQHVATYTGQNGPFGDEFPGQYHYLHFVSDGTVSAEGFSFTAQYRD